MCFAEKQSILDQTPAPDLFRSGTRASEETMKKQQDLLWGGDRPGRTMTMGVQHVFAMFGSTVLVPALTGLDASVTLMSMGTGTLLFHLVTKGMVPAFMGSSFSFIAAICAVMSKTGGSTAAVGWGIMASGLLYLLLSCLVRLFGAKRITGFFPPVVTGCMIVIIGVMLAPTAMSNITAVRGEVPQGAIVTVTRGSAETDRFLLCEYDGAAGWLRAENLLRTPDAEADGVNGIPAYTNPGTDYTVLRAGGVRLLEEPSDDARTVSGTLLWKHWTVALFTILVIVLVMFFARGFFHLIPILIGIAAGYLLSITLGIVDLTPVREAGWLTVPEISFFTACADRSAVLFSVTMIAPISVVTFVEHVGDITANGAVTGHNYLEDPGLHRTLLGCGLASLFSGALGGPAATTYSENTGVLAATKNYNPATLRFAALFAILLAFIGKVSGVLRSIPMPVMGGVSVVLFGMIGSVGLRMLVENRVDFTRSRNLIIAGSMLVFGLGLPGGVTLGGVTVSGTALAAVLGIVLGKALPGTEAEERRAGRKD